MFRERIAVFPHFVKKFFYDHDISKLNLDINKTQAKILMLINENNDKSMSEISLIAGLEKSSFTRSVDYLVSMGFITRNQTKNDRRITKLSFTEKGSRAVDILRNDFDFYWESLISGFSEDEKKEFFESLETISKYLNKMITGKQK